jgi:hypothetical protein
VIDSSGKQETHPVPRGFPLRTVLWCMMRGAAVAIVGSVAIAFFARLNGHVLQGIPWFLVTTAITCLAIVRRSTFRRLSNPVALQPPALVLISAGLTLALAAVAIAVTGLPNVMAGMTRLPGDAVPGSPLFQGLVSFSAVAGAAFVEEGAIRGQVQSRLQIYVSPRRAEILSDVLLVFLHVLRFSTPGMIVFVIFLSIAGGRIAALTQTIRWPIAIHLGANLLVLGAVLTYRVVPLVGR